MFKLTENMAGFNQSCCVENVDFSFLKAYVAYVCDSIAAAIICTLFFSACIQSILSLY